MSAINKMVEILKGALEDYTQYGEGKALTEKGQGIKECMEKCLGHATRLAAEEKSGDEGLLEVKKFVTESIKGLEDHALRIEAELLDKWISAAAKSESLACIAHQQQRLMEVDSAIDEQMSRHPTPKEATEGLREFLDREIHLLKTQSLPGPFQDGMIYAYRKVLDRPAPVKEPPPPFKLKLRPECPYCKAVRPAPVKEAPAELAKELSAMCSEAEKEEVPLDELGQEILERISPNMIRDILSRYHPTPSRTDKLEIVCPFCGFEGEAIRVCPSCGVSERGEQHHLAQPPDRAADLVKRLKEFCKDKARGHEACTITPLEILEILRDYEKEAK